MNAKDPFDFSGLSLVPLDGQPAAAAAPKAPGEKSVFHANTREGRDRRVNPDRRQTLRMEPDRRSGKDRRPRAGWEPGKNL